MSWGLWFTAWVGVRGLVNDELAFFGGLHVASIGLTACGVCLA